MRRSEIITIINADCLLVSNNLLHSLLLLCAVLVILGCTGKQVGDSEEKMTEVQWTARHYHELGMEYDFQRHQMRIAELYYRKSYEILKNDPSQAWDIYGDAGYRYACMLIQRGDMEGALTVINEILNKSEGNDDFPGSQKAFLYSLMAQCQLHLAMPEAAKQTFGKAYEQQLNVLGGKEKGDFNLAILCNNIFLSFFEMGEYEEAGKWLGHYEEELRACERLGVGDSLIILEHNGLLALYKAQYLLATGQANEAAAVFANIPRDQLENPSCIETATAYLMAAGRYAEAADMFDRLDTTFAAIDSSAFTFDVISASLAPRYMANRRSGRVAEALALADKTFAAIDSALAWQKQNDAAELAVIYQTHEKDLALEESEARATIYHIILFSAVIIILLIAYLLRRAYTYNKVLTEKNRRLLADIEQREQEQQQSIELLKAKPEDVLTAEQQLFRRICDLMDSSDHIYTDADLDRNRLAQLLGTNEHYVTDAISACTDGKSVNAFLNEYRLRYSTRLLATTKDSVSLIAELSGFSRSSFFRIFSDAYGMSPTDYRKAAGK